MLSISDSTNWKKQKLITFSFLKILKFFFCMVRFVFLQRIQLHQKPIFQKKCWTTTFFIWTAVCKAHFKHTNFFQTLIKSTPSPPPFPAPFQKSWLRPWRISDFNTHLHTFFMIQHSFLIH